MNPLIIILGIVIIVILYYLIKYYFFTTKSLATKIHLKASPLDISSNVINNPNSILYTFGTWVYVNNFSNCRLLTYATSSNIQDTNNTLFTLVLGQDGNIGNRDKPKLIAFINGRGANNQNINVQVNVTNNFPMQKWVHVLISVDTGFVDCYIDGKLVISNPLTPDKQIMNSPTITPSITFKQTSGSNPDIYLAKLTRWDYPLDPQSVWTEYSAGNGIKEDEFAVNLLVKTSEAENNYQIY